MEEIDWQIAKWVYWVISGGQIYNKEFLEQGGIIFTNSKLT